MTDSKQVLCLELPEGDAKDSILKIYESFNEMLERVTTREKHLLSQVEELNKKETHLRHAIQREKTRGERLRKILALTDIIFNIGSEQEIYNAAVNILHKLYPNAVIRLLCVSNSRTKMEVKAACGPTNINAERCCITPTECLAVKTGKSLVNPSRSQGIFCHRLTSYAEVRSHICIPLFSEGNIFGCLSLFAEQENSFFDAYEVEIINLFANLIGISIANTRLVNIAQKESFTDHLTGLPNRRYAFKVLQQELERAKRYGGVFSVALIDIDKFKVVNDTYGHDEGDRVLVLLADVARRCFRKSDVTARFGGEEFLIIMPETIVEASLQVINRFRATFNEATLSGMLKASNITVSAGIAQYPADGQDLATLLKTADSRLYKAKESGRNRAVWSNEQ